MLEVRDINREAEPHLFLTASIMHFFDRWIVISNVRQHLYQTRRKINFIYQLGNISINIPVTITKKPKYQPVIL